MRARAGGVYEEGAGEGVRTAVDLHGASKFGTFTALGAQAEPDETCNLSRRGKETRRAFLEDTEEERVGMPVTGSPERSSSISPEGAGTRSRESEEWRR